MGRHVADTWAGSCRCSISALRDSLSGNTAHKSECYYFLVLLLTSLCPAPTAAQLDHSLAGAGCKSRAVRASIQALDQTAVGHVILSLRNKKPFLKADGPLLICARPDGGLVCFQGAAWCRRVHHPLLGHSYQCRADAGPRCICDIATDLASPRRHRFPQSRHPWTNRLARYHLCSSPEQSLMPAMAARPAATVAAAAQTKARAPPVAAVTARAGWPVVIWMTATRIAAAPT